MTYLLLCAVFLAVAAAVLGAGLARSRRAGSLIRSWWPAWVAAAIVLLVLTAVFDNVMIAAGLFDYDPENISGVRLGLVPIEDFAYPLAGLMLLPGIWLLLEPRADRDRALAAGPRIRSSADRSADRDAERAAAHGADRVPGADSTLGGTR